ncbi:MAG: DUF4091 domain-containing protein, partial [Phycisphaerae bacterium]|nr:DUF4091 domain-containing protein [Phycisphaerae bacterium]
AANETVSFQLVLDAPASGLTEVRVAVGPLSGPDRQKIIAENIKLFRMFPVAIERYPAWYLRLTDAPVKPARFYDSLKLIGPDESFKVGPGERLAVWVDVAVPRDALPGDYVGAVTVLTNKGAMRAKVAMKVYDFVLPDARPVACLGGFAHETIFSTFDGSVPVRLDAARRDVRAGLTIIRRLMRLAHEHRIDLFDRSIHPTIKRDAAGAVALQWDDYDNIVKPYLDGTAFADRIGVAAWPAPFRATGGDGWPKPTNYGGIDAEAYRKTASTVLSETVKHFKSIGFEDRLFVWPRSDPSVRSAYERHAVLARLVRSAGSETPILTELPPDPPAQTGWNPPEDFGSLADMYAPPAHLMNPKEAKRLTGQSHLLEGLWLRPGRPPYLGSCGVLGSPADVRALAWVAMKYDCPGIFLPEVLNWSAQATGGEDRLFYPGKDALANTVLPSVRLKRLRRGLQDSAYLWLLRQRGKEAVARIMIDTMVHYACLAAAGDHYLDTRLDGWVADGRIWVAARRLLAEEVLSAVHPEKVSRRRLLAEQLAWKQLQQRTCRVRVERIRSHAEILSAGGIRAVIRTELYNQRARPVEVQLRIANLPVGWKPITDRSSLRLAGGELAVVELSAEGDHPSTGPDAKINIPLMLTADLHQKTEIPAGVPFIQTGLVTDAIVIDGKLGDWPLRPGNTAGNFIVLGRRGRGGKGLARRQTAVFAARDERNLYLAFRCDEPEMDKIQARADNIVRYEQFLAAGEDMVEVIIDPGRRAKNASDLYHLVVKSNGVVLAERGVGAEEHKVRPWPVRLRSAVAMGEKLWVVELAIPLDSFGPDEPSPIWGINFTRFATAEAEASSWSGAVRYFYNPENLGTIYLPPTKE